MTADCYTFPDIVRFNCDGWAQVRERRGSESVIHYNSGGIEPFNLVHPGVISDQVEQPEKVLRIKKASPRSVPAKSQSDV